MYSPLLQQAFRKILFIFMNLQYTKIFTAQMMLFFLFKQIKMYILNQVKFAKYFKCPRKKNKSSNKQLLITYQFMVILFLIVGIVDSYLESICYIFLFILPSFSDYFNLIYFAFILIQNFKVNLYNNILPNSLC